jgi:tetratricopeptide (TPR) repeat protein
MRVSYSLLLFVALLFGCGRLVLAQSKAIQETTSSTAASLSTREPGSVPTSGSDSTATKEISKADRESAKRSYKAGISYKRGGLVRQAMQSFQQAIDSDPEFADAYSALGQTCFDLGAYQEAVVALEKAVKLNPKATDAYTLLGQAYAKSKEKGSVQEKPIDLNATESTLVSTKPDSNDDDKRVP